MWLTHSTLKVLRTVHLYLGVFAAPALLFIAVTGGAQVFNLHETVRGSSYAPPTWLVYAARMHKKQDLAVPPPKPVAAATPQGRAVAGAPPALSPSPVAAGTTPAHWAMKLFFGVIALSLLLSVLTGLVMAYRSSRRPGLFGALLAAGTVLPLLILAA